MTFSATSVSVAKLTDEEKRLEKEVAIEQWSKDRAQMLAKANSRINGRLLNSAFTGANDEFLFTSFLRSGCGFITPEPRATPICPMDTVHRHTASPIKLRSTEA